MHSQFSHSLDEESASAFPGILCVGVSHQTARADVREALSFSSLETESALRSARHDAGIERLVIVSTCHRTELYADISTKRGAPPALLHQAGLDKRVKEWFATNRGVSREVLDTCSYTHLGDAAVNHLFRLACGLESVIPGEPQIVSQVAGSLARSVSAHTASPALKKAFRLAVQAGERMQADVWGRLRRADLGTAAAAAALRFLEDSGTTFRRAHVAVVGAGELGELTVSAVREAGASDVTIVNRTPHRAALLAERHGVCARSLNELTSVLAQSDVAIFALAESRFVIPFDLVRDLMRGREARPLALIDVGLPRNVDVRSGRVAGVKLIGIDELADSRGEGHATRSAVIPLVEELVRARSALPPQAPSSSQPDMLGARAWG